MAQQGELETALALFERSLAIWRESGDRDQQAKELNSLGITYGYAGNLELARSLLEESAAIAREIGSDLRLAAALTNLGTVETTAGNLERATKVLEEALALDKRQGDLLGTVMDKHALAMVKLRAGRAAQARELLVSTVDLVVSAGNTDILAMTLELAACVTAEFGDCVLAPRLAGAAEAVRQVAGMPILESDAALVERFLAPARATTARRDWDSEVATGRALSLEQVFSLLLTLADAA
jgi:tetratricopeptide (TPR) repeat protein